MTVDSFDDSSDLFGSPVPFDASEVGLWNGRFVPPPPRPPQFLDESMLNEGGSICDLCSWAVPAKNTFIFENNTENRSELGGPLTLVTASVLLVLLGTIILIKVVRWKRKTPSNRFEAHVQWWSRKKRPNSNDKNQWRCNNIYTAQPTDSVRGLPQPALLLATSCDTSHITTRPDSSPQLQQQDSQTHLPPHHCQQHQHQQQQHAPIQQTQHLTLQLPLEHQVSSALSPSVLPPATYCATPLLTMQLQLQEHQHRLREDVCHWPSSSIIVAR